MGRLVRIVAGIAVVVGLTACTPAPEPVTPSGTESPSEDADRADLAPLDAYLGSGAWSDPSGTAVDPMLSVEELVAQCMAEQGFEYVPQRTRFTELAPGEPQWHTREYAERYGYGTFVQPKLVETQANDNPNAEILASMTLAERAAYDIALNGTSDGGIFNSGDEIDLEAFGCEGLRIAAMVNGDGKDDPVYVDATAHSRHIDEVLVMEDPRVVAADAQWAECMSDAGWPGLASSFDAQALAATWQDDLIDPQTSVMSQPSPELLDDAISLALADFDCAAEIELTELRDEVRAELQQEYVDQHREELDTWLQTWGDAQPTH